MRSRARRFARIAVITLIPAAVSLAQQSSAPIPLTLQQAAQIAIEKNPLRKAALADTKAASAGIREARSALMPRLTFSEVATRGNDPVYIFGAKLRQARFTEADFALNRLNTPLPFGNFTTRFGGSWNLFDSFASWHRIAQAKSMDDASQHQLERTDQEIVYRVVSAYYAVLQAERQQQVVEDALKTTQSILERSQARFESGLAVESDLLSAKVRMSSRQQELIRARNDVALRRAQLNAALGVAVDSVFQLNQETDEKTLPIPALTELERQALVNRPDLKRIESEESAQKQNVSIAKSSFGPRVNAFAGWEMDNPTFLAGGGGNNWLGGIEVQFDLFEGGAKRARLSRQRALQEKMSALKQVATDDIRLNVRRAYYDVDSSRQQIEVARAATGEAQESLRIVQNRYDAGLTTMTDLLGTEESWRRTQTDYWDAVYRFRTAYAGLELARGTLNTQSPAVLP